MPCTPTFGTAHLFGLVDDDRSRQLLWDARALGFERIDTAPSYGRGRAEVAVGELLAEQQGWVVTTKVGIAAVPAPGRAGRLARAVARRLPEPAQQRLRGPRPPGGGRFDPESVMSSVRASVQRLGPVDRLMLHEPLPADITGELGQQLDELAAEGVIGTLGLAARNEDTVPCLDAAPGRFGVVHLAVGATSTLPPVPPGVRVVGHGALGAAGADLHTLRYRLEAGGDWAHRWYEATAGTPRAPDSGLADALVVRALRRGPDELIVASSRPERLAHLAELVRQPPPPVGEVDRLLDEVFGPSRPPLG